MPDRAPESALSVLAERRDRFSGGEKAPGKVGRRCFGARDCYRPGEMAARGPRIDPSHGRGSPRARSTREDGGSSLVLSDRVVWGGASIAGDAVRVSDRRSVIHPARLETRTKESNMCASHWVLRNLKA